MGALLQLAVTLHEINCGECGGTYAINERYREQRETKGGGWNCPYCRVGWGYFKNTLNDKLKKEIEEERARKQAALDRANQAEANLAQAIRKNTAVMKRIHAGTCPCCKRTFKQLAAHMKRKHPDAVT